MLRSARLLTIARRAFSSEGAAASAAAPNAPDAPNTPNPPNPLKPKSKRPRTPFINQPSEVVLENLAWKEASKLVSNYRVGRRRGGVLKLGERRPIILGQRARNAELERKAAERQLPWRIMASV